MEDLMLKIDNVSKEYKLGQIGGGTLRDELQRIKAKMLHKADPTKKIGAKDYNRGEIFKALNGVSFEVKRGERVGIIGHNGAGKSTLLKLISRVTAPTGGTISLNGRIASMLEVGTGFHPELTGRENIYMNGAILGMTKKEIDRKIEDIIDFSECRQFIDTPVKRYSSGMYVKLAFSVAAHLDSEIMIMDEVLAVGDMAFQKKCIDKMNQVSKDEGRTILYVSHNMNTIRQLCDRVIVLDHGKIVFNGDVEEGIGIYYNNSGKELPIKYSLDKIARPSAFHGSKIHLTNFIFLNKKQAKFNSNEEIKFSISFKSNSEISGLKLFLVIFSDFGDRIGMTQLIKGFVDTKENMNYTAKFCFNSSLLVAGKYKFVLDIFSSDENGNHLSYDHPQCDIFFEIVGKENDGLKWSKYFGNIRFDNLRVIE